MKNKSNENNDSKIIDLEQKRKERKQKKKSSGKKFVIFMLLVAVLAILMSPYFNIKWFDVKGNSRVSAEQIKSASGVALGDNMFRLNIKKSKESIKKIPYIDTAHIYRNLSGGIVIEVTEREAFAYIRHNAGDIVIDKTGRILELAGKDYDYKELVELTGLKCTSTKPSETIGKNYEENIKTAVTIYDMLKKHSIDERVSSLNVGKLKGITMVFDGDKTVLLGDSYRLEYKLAMLVTTLASLAPSDKGTIDLRKEGQALFTPKE